MVEHSIGFEIRTLSNLLKRSVAKSIPGDEGKPPTEMHGMIIDYLFQNRNTSIYQKDIENHFSIRRSTASGILRLMEKKGIIHRLSVVDDARLKKLVLSDHAASIHEQVQEKLKEAEKKMTEGIDEKDLEIFFEVIRKIKYNLD